jgi:hypothetical protein
MAKTKISEYSATPADNTDISNINIAEGCSPANVNNAIRGLMAQLKDQQAGTSGDPFTVGGNLTVTGTTTFTGGLASALSIANGGTGSTTASGARTNLSAAASGANSDITSLAGITAGTATAPAFTTSGDINTGMFFPAADTIAFSEGGVEAMRLDSSGNVGIGTASPTQKLQVYTSASNGGQIQITNASTGAISTDGLLLGYDSSNDVIINNQEATPTKFYTSGTERMRIDSSGSVLIGGSTAAAGPVLLAKGGAGGGSIIQFFKPNSGATNVILNYYGTSTYVGGMNMDNTSTSFITSSDIRLKKDIVDAPSATQKIDNIRIVSHGWKHDEAVVDFGIIAQELYEIMPRAVTKGDDGEEVETTWSVDYSKLVPMLIKAHQEQQTIINDLKARITALEAK